MNINRSIKRAAQWTNMLTKSEQYLTLHVLYREQAQIDIAAKYGAFTLWVEKTVSICASD